MSIQLKVGQVFKLDDTYLEVHKILPEQTVFRTPSSAKLLALRPEQVEDLKIKAQFLGDAREPKINQVYKHREDGQLLYIWGFDGGIILFAPVGEIRAKFYYTSLFKALEKNEYLGEMPIIGGTYRHGERSVREVVGFSGIRVKLKNTRSGGTYFMPLSAFLKNYKPFVVVEEYVDEPQPNSVFFDRKTDSIFKYESARGVHSLLNLKTNLRVISHALLATIKDFELIGLLPKEGDRFERNGHVVIVSRIEKDQVFCEYDNHRLYGRETKIPLYVLLTTYVKYVSQHTINKLVESGYLPPKYELHPWQQQLQDGIERLERAVKNDQHLTSVRDWNLTPTGRKKSEPEVQEFPNGHMSQKIGRGFRPKPDVLILDFANFTWPTPTPEQTEKVNLTIRKTPVNPWVVFSPENGKDPELVVVGFDHAPQRDEFTMWSILAFAGNHFHTKALTLLPQVGDVYASKSHGSEVEVVKVRRNGYTVSNGRRKWKVNSQALGINYKWVR